MSITERAEDMIYSMIEEYRKVNKDISALKDDSNKLVEYLNDIRVTITPSYALKRLICNKYSTRYDNETKSYILEIIDKSKNCIQVQVDDYDAKDGSDEGCIEALVLLAKANGVPITKQNAANWLDNEKSYSRNAFFKIAFALHLDSNEVQTFLMKELGEQGYNFKSCEEVVYWFCATFDEYNNYNEALAIIDEIEAAFEENLAPTSTETEYYKNILSGIETKNDLISKIIENKKYFFFYPSDDSIKPKDLSAEQKKEYKEKPKSVRAKKGSYLASNKLKTAFCELLDEAKALYSLANKEEYNNEKLAYTIWDGIPREGKEDVTRVRNRDSSTIGEYISLKGTNLPKQISQNLLIRDRMDALYNGKIPVTRKDIITISYFVITIKVEMALSGSFSHTDYAEEFEEIASNISEDKPYFNMLYFQDELNLLLDDLGFSPLYAPNRFDNIIMLSTLSSEPAQFFSDIIETAILSPKSE